MRYTHGELVAMGLVLQLAYYGRQDEAAAFAARLRGWGLPASLGDMGLTPGAADVEACIDYYSVTDEMKAAGEAAVPRLREALKAVFS